MQRISVVTSKFSKSLLIMGDNIGISIDIENLENLSTGYIVLKETKLVKNIF